MVICRIMRLDLDAEVWYKTEDDSLTGLYEQDTKKQQKERHMGH